MSVTQSFTVSSSDPNVVTKNATLINPGNINHFVQHTNAINSLHPTTLQVSNSANAETISIESSSPVVFVVPYQQHAEQDTTSIWQRIQSIALVLILIVVFLTAIRSIISFFTTPSTGTNSQTEIAAATALATELEDVT